MTVYDLNWQPARIGTGFIASHVFENGITAQVRCTAIGEGEEYYHLVLLSHGGRVVYDHGELDRVALAARLESVPYRKIRR